MSFKLFKSEVLGNLRTQHDSKTKTSQIIGTAYNNLVQRMIEPLTGGMTFYSCIPKTPSLITGIQSVFTKNITSSKKSVNIFKQFEPFILSYWAGANTVGPLGAVTITSTGSFKGPIIPENTNPTLWLDVFCAVASVHIKSLVGIYVNSASGTTTPWSGAMLVVL